MRSASSAPACRLAVGVLAVLFGVRAEALSPQEQRGSGPAAEAARSAPPAGLSDRAWQAIREAIERDGHTVRSRAASFPTEDAKLSASDATGPQFFGTSVAVSGDTVVVGARLASEDGVATGAAYVFVEPPGGWSGSLTETARLTAGDAVAGDDFGTGVGISGDTVVVGASGHRDDTGAVYVFVEPAGGWGGNLTQSAKLSASDRLRSDEFGLDVAVEGSTVAVGAWAFSSPEAGAAYVFVEPAGGWSGNLTESARLTASDVGVDDLFGGSVGVSGDTVVVGAADNEGSGSAYVFVEPAGGWGGDLAEDAKLRASDAAGGDLFGREVAVSGDTVVVGALSDDDHGDGSGSAYVFVEPGGGWSGSLAEDAKLTAGDGAEGDRFGGDVAISGDTVVIGAWGERNSAGAVYVFAEPVGGWSGDLTEDAKLTASDGFVNDFFGTDVAASAGDVVGGAWSADGTVPDSGAAYVFAERSCELLVEIARVLPSGEPLQAQLSITHHRLAIVTVPFVLEVFDRRGRPVTDGETPAFTLHPGETVETSHTLDLTGVRPGAYRLVVSMDQMQGGTEMTSVWFRVR